MRNFLLFLLVSVRLIQADGTNQDTPPLVQNPWVTIFIHGIISVKPHLSMTNFVRFMRDKIADSTYSRTVEIIRKNDFFYQYHTMQELGLHPVDLSICRAGAASVAFTRAYNVLTKKIEAEPAKHYFYTFGWSGLLSAKMRSLEAELLYTSLVDLISDFNQQGIFPKIRIVGYSHGGNVALNLASAARTKKDQDSSFVVDELILLGVPVLPDALSLVSSILFKDVYHIFSVRDRIQTLDCFAINRFFSDRMFRGTPDMPLPKNLTQIQLNIRRPIEKTYAPKICSHDKKSRCLHHRNKLRNVDPGHTELWSFGWTASHYRDKHPLHPLPAGVLIPYIIEPLKRHAITSRNLVVEFQPHEESIIITDNTTKKIHLIPFISKEELKKLCQETLAYKPINFDKETFDTHVHNAIAQAQQERSLERAQQKKQRRAHRRTNAKRVCV
jgi:hypothetical protein